MREKEAMSGRLRSCVRRMARSDEGAQLVEMCISLLVLVALLLGTMEFSLAFLAYNEVTDAAREAARWAMVRGSTSCANTSGLSKCNATETDIQTYVRGMGLPLLVSSNIIVTATWLAATPSPPTSWSTCAGGCTKDPGNEVQVRVSYSLPLIINFWNTATNKFIATRSTWNITSTSTMVVSQ